MRTKFACLSSLLIALALPATAAADGGPILGPSYDDQGVTGLAGTPAAQFRYVALLGGRSGNALAKISTDDGRAANWRFFGAPWAPPAVTITDDAGGLSADGGTLVLASGLYHPRAKQTRYLILDPNRLRIERRLSLDGQSSFDAISPDGRLLYLVQYKDPVRHPLDYRVRAYDLAKGAFRPGEIVDPDEPDERMAGYPLARGYSDDGRWAYTLYGGGDEPFIHALDTEGATAVCVDLPMLSNGSIWRKGLSVGADGGPIEVLNHGDVAALVDQQTFEVTEPDSPAPADQAAGGGGALPWLAIAGGGLLAALAIAGLRRRRIAAQPVP
jgi:hypothetical protein